MANLKILSLLYWYFFKISTVY